MKTLKIKNSLWVQFEGKIYQINKKAVAGVASDSASAVELEAPFTCKVLKIHVKPGLSLKPGDPVVTVEAMKMEFSYTSPRAGTVHNVLVQEGQVINSGQKFVAWKET